MGGRVPRRHVSVSPVPDRVSPVTAGNRGVGHAFGRPHFHPAHLDRKAVEQRTLLERFPMVTDLQSAWLILLHCKANRQPPE